MKILHAHMTLASGGVESMITALANEMAKDNQVEILLIFQPKEDDLFLKRLKPNIKVYTLGKKSPGISIKYIYKMYRFIRKGDYDIVNIHGFFYYNFLSVLFNHRHTKYYYTVHSDAVMENLNWDGKLFRLKRFCFCRQWMRPITISKASQDSFTHLYGCKSYLIPNGVTKPKIELPFKYPFVEKYRYTSKTKVIVHAGRISTPKNQIVMCKAVRRTIEEGRDVVLLIAGDNRDEVIFTQMKPYLDSERIVYIGERSDVSLLFASADAMFLPSIWEGMPVVLLEALSVGCIPICTAVGGIVNAIRDGENGILSEDSSEHSVYEALNRYLNLNEDEILVMRNNCMKSFKPYDISETTRNYIKAYKSNVIL